MARTEEAVRAPAQRPTSPAGEARPVSNTAAASPTTRRVAVPRPPGIPILVASVVFVATLGFLFFRDQSAYVSTDNALVTGAVVQVGSPSTGQLRSVNVDVGDEVSQGQILANIAMTTPQNAPQAPVTRASVRAPIDGVVVARQGNPGEAVTSGRAILTLVDPTTLWVQAQIDEGQIGRVHPGQPVEVTITAIGQTFPGRVAAIGPASMAASQAMQGIGLPGLQRAVQLVPVRVEVDYGDLPLVLGSSAAVKIRVQE